MALWLHPFVGREGAVRHYRRVHAGGLPPETAAPQRRVSVRLLVGDDQVIRGPENAAPLKGVVYGETDPGNDEIVGTVGMMAQEIPIVTITHQVAVEIPQPGGSVVQALAVDGGVVEQIAAATAVSYDGRAPPVGQGGRMVGGAESLVPVRWKRIIVLVGVELHEQSDLTVRCPLALARESAGNNIAARIAMIAITTSSSISVNPRRCCSGVSLTISRLISVIHFRLS